MKKKDEWGGMVSGFVKGKRDLVFKRLPSSKGKMALGLFPRSRVQKKKGKDGTILFLGV